MASELAIFWSIPLRHVGNARFYVGSLDRLSVGNWLTEEMPMDYTVSMTMVPSDNCRRKRQDKSSVGQ